MVPVNLMTLLTWSIAIVTAIGAVILFVGFLSGDDSGQSLQALVPPEIWDQLSPAARASFKVASEAPPERREKFRRLLLRMAEGYLAEKKSPEAEAAYVTALLQSLGKFTL